MSASMRRRLPRLLRWTAVVVAAVSLVVAACGNDDPTTVGGPLLRGATVHTFEVVLDAQDFLVSDTAFAGFLTPAGAAITVTANDFGGVLDAHTLLEFGLIPDIFDVIGPNGSAGTDSGTVIGADIVVRIDSSTIGDGPSTLALNFLTESWDRPTVTWQNRADTNDVQTAWMQPGGTMGALIDTVVWRPGADSLIFHVDSQAVRMMRDSTVRSNGIVLSARDPNVRLESPGVAMTVLARPKTIPDTIVTAAVNVTRSIFIFQPDPPPPPTALRVGGIPEWRSVLRFRQGWDTLTLACPGIANCRIPLNRATLSTAELLLQPVPAPAAFRSGDTIGVVTRPVVTSPLIPIERSPFGDLVSVQPGTAPPSAFTLEPGSAALVAVPIRSFIQALIGSDTIAGAPHTLALLPAVIGQDLGFGTFGPLSAGALAPRLRLVFTITDEALIR